LVGDGARGSHNAIELAAPVLVCCLMDLIQSRLSLLHQGVLSPVLLGLGNPHEFRVLQSFAPSREVDRLLDPILAESPLLDDLMRRAHHTRSVLKDAALCRARDASRAKELPARGIGRLSEVEHGLDHYFFV